MSQDKANRDRNKKILTMNTQRVDNVACPHCKNNKNYKLIRPPNKWRDGEWEMVCVGCQKEFNLYIVLSIHTLQTKAQLAEMGRKARENEDRARKENNVQTVETSVGSPANCEHSQPSCDECKGVGPHTHSNEPVTAAQGDAPNSAS